MSSDPLTHTHTFASLQLVTCSNEGKVVVWKLMDERRSMDEIWPLFSFSINPQSSGDGELNRAATVVRGEETERRGRGERGRERGLLPVRQPLAILRD